MKTVLLILVILETIGIIFLLMRSFLVDRTLRNIINNSEEIVKKNIEVEDIRVKGSKSCEQLANSINVIKSNLRAFIESTKGNVIVLSDAIEVLSNASKANEVGTEKTSESICVVAQKASEQLDLVKDNLDLIEANTNQLEIIDESMNVVKHALSESVSSCKVGVSNLEKYESDVAEIETNLNEAMEILQQFNTQIKQVNSIGELVVEVSDELQLLALNASIEASRAGDAGRGFSVVSKEMGTMSEKTRESMDEITRILNDVTESSSKVTDSINNCCVAFRNSSEVFWGLSDSLRTISSMSNDVNDKMIDMTDKYAMIAQNSDVSREKAQNVFSASGVISDSTRDIAAISEETTAESIRISDNVVSLEEMLKGIKGLIGQFNTGVNASSKNRDRKVKIAFFSKLDNYFWQSIKRGVLYAQKELSNNNVDIIYYAYKDDIEEQNFVSDVNKCIADNVDCIIFPGFLNKADDVLARAANQGTIIFAYNCDCNSKINRIAVYEPDQVEAGELAAKATAKALNGAGNIAIVVGDMTADVNRIRYESFVKYVKKNYKDIKIIETLEISYDASKTYKQEYKLIKDHPEIDLIYLTTGMQLELAKAIVDSGNSGKMQAVVFDQNNDIYEYIKKGIIAAAIDHDPFSQGHDPIIYMYNYIVDGKKPVSDRIKCIASVVDIDNVNGKVCVE